MAILAVLLLAFGVKLITNVLWYDPEEDKVCHRFLWVLWLDLPSQLMLPLLFLKRTGNLPECTPAAPPE